jgi:hypothetical protein
LRMCSRNESDLALWQLRSFCSSFGHQHLVVFHRKETWTSVFEPSLTFWVGGELVLWGVADLEHYILRRFSIRKYFNVINHTTMSFGKAKVYQIEYKNIDHKGNMIHQILLISRNFIFPNNIFKKMISLPRGVAQCETCLACPSPGVNP